MATATQAGFMPSARRKSAHLLHAGSILEKHEPKPPRPSSDRVCFDCAIHNLAKAREILRQVLLAGVPAEASDEHFPGEQETRIGVRERPGAPPAPPQAAGDVRAPLGPPVRVPAPRKLGHPRGTQRRARPRCGKGRPRSRQPPSRPPEPQGGGRKWPRGSPTPPPRHIPGPTRRPAGSCSR